MNKQQFMGELKQLLGELPVDEREEALSYYEDYFADAGEENEAAVIAELQSPEKVAFTIKAGLADADKIEGEFTDTGFKGYSNDSRDEIINAIPGSEERGFKQANPNTGNNILITILVLILLSPILIPVFCSIFGVLFGLSVAALAVMIAIAVAGIACIVAGGIVLVTGITGMSALPMGALLLAGVALILFGIGSVLVTVGTKIIALIVPAFFRAITSLARKMIDKINSKRGNL